MTAGKRRFKYPQESYRYDLADEGVRGRRPVLVGYDSLSDDLVYPYRVPPGELDLRGGIFYSLLGLLLVRCAKCNRCKRACSLHCTESKPS